MKSIQEFLAVITSFINTTVIPLLFAIAFLAFIFNVVRYFIIGGDNKVGQEKAKRYALYSIAAFVLMVSIWGLVNILVNGFGICRGGALTPDYIDKSPHNAIMPCDYVPLPKQRPSGSQNPYDGTSWQEQSDGTWQQQ